MYPPLKQDGNGQPWTPSSGGPFRAIVLVAGIAFSAWSAAELYSIWAHPLPARRSAKLLQDLEEMQARLTSEVERLRTEPGERPETRRQTEIALRTFENLVQDLHQRAAGMEGVRLAVGRASQHLTMAAFSIREFGQISREEDARTRRLEAMADLVMALAETKQAVQSVSSPSWDLVIRERNIRIRRTAGSLAFGLVTTLLLIGLFAGRWRRAPYAPPEPHAWPVVEAGSSRTADMVINLDDTMVVRAGAEGPEPGTRVESGAPGSGRGPGGADAARSLAGVIAQGLRHDLTVINGYADFLLDSIAEDDPIRGDLHVIRRMGERINVLAGQLQAYSDPSPGTREPIDVNAWIESLRERLEVLLEPGISIAYNLSPSAGVVHGTPDHLERAVQSLIARAVTSMPAGGKIVIETSTREAEGECSSAVVIRHTGPGFAAGTLRGLRLANLLGPGEFHTADLSLFAVSSIVEGHPGRIETGSCAEGGSECVILLPAAERPHATRGEFAASDSLE
jgi:signal transduction histidine kinase